MSNYHSWGGYPKTKPSHVHSMNWRTEPITFNDWEIPVLPYAYGRSYGDSCQNDGGILLSTKRLRHFLAFDEERGIVRCEGGVSIADLLESFTPRGWFPPVTPGTKYVSIGGAIANDVHGKNHHREGTFGCHVLQLELLRSTGERIRCSPNEHHDLFEATIGGLGLTGVILWADIQLKPIHNAYMNIERMRFFSLDEFFELTKNSDQSYEYTVAWIDCLVGHRRLGRGIFMRGNHASSDHVCIPFSRSAHSLSIPFDLPSGFLNRQSLKLFNSLFFHNQAPDPEQSLEFYDTFFYPLDRVQHWNRIYGKQGFLQYQCVIPPSYEHDGIHELLTIISQARQGSFLGVLKKFGNIPSPGMLSFPRPGTTFALDFPFLGKETLLLLKKLDEVVRKYGGAVYPAKDARMSAKDFQTYFPQWHTYCQYKDPQFSSSFWRRTTKIDSDGSESLATHLNTQTTNRAKTLA